MASAELLALGRQFVEWDVNPVTKAEAARIVEAAGAAAPTAEAVADLQKAFGSRLEFGTAGLRGEMGPGCARMNDLTVIEAAQGLTEHILAAFPPEEARTRGVVLGYDHRARGEDKHITSHRFALLTAIALLSKGIRVYLYNKLVATPLVPFGILHTGAVAGVMVTASHNPKQDDGYKVYWANGAQIISPVDKGIAAAMTRNVQPWAPCAAAYAAARTDDVVRAFAASTGLPTAVCEDKTEELVAAYLRDITGSLSVRKGDKLAAARAALADDGSNPVVVAYTAMHGVGRPFAAAMFESFGLPPFVPTPEQVEPDHTFPTVAFPNPEEGKGALTLAMKAADAAGATLILANDPDADRLAVAAFVPADAAAAAAGGAASASTAAVTTATGRPGEWKVFTGNEIGAMLAHWSWVKFQAGGGNPADAIMIASTVSSKMIAAMAAKEGFAFQETLTGFKWMGNAMEAHEKAGRKVLFAFEEAIGFACGPLVRDKDGVSGAAVFAEMANYYARQGRSVVQHLQYLYETYGHFVTNNYYVFVDEPSKTNTIFKRLRNEGHYWARLGDLRITAIRDLTSPGWDSETADGKTSLPTSGGSHMITYKFSNGVTATLRTSGTEPKLKYYTELTGADRGVVKAELARTVNLILDEMLQPEKYGLKRPVVE